MFLDVINAMWLLRLIASVILWTINHLSLSYFHRQNPQFGEHFCSVSWSSLQAWMCFLPMKEGSVSTGHFLPGTYRHLIMNGDLQEPPGALSFPAEQRGHQKERPSEMTHPSHTVSQEQPGNTPQCPISLLVEMPGSSSSFGKHCLFILIWTSGCWQSSASARKAVLFSSVQLL